MKKGTLILLIIIALSATANSINGIENEQLKSWKARRDFKVEKQTRDYSCGVASLATILKDKFNKDISEEILFKQLIKIKGQTETVTEEIKYYSLLDIKKLAEIVGYKAFGLAIDFNGLCKIEKPVMVYIEPNGINHFSVVSKIDEDYVYLADPSWGNVKYIKEKFIDMWKTRKDTKHYGRVLTIMTGNQLK